MNWSKLNEFKFKKTNDAPSNGRWWPSFDCQKYLWQGSNIALSWPTKQQLFFKKIWWPHLSGWVKSWEKILKNNIIQFIKKTVNTSLVKETDKNVRPTNAVKTIKEKHLKII